MSSFALIDNDVIIKCSCIGTIDEVFKLLRGVQVCALEVARFSVPAALKRHHIRAPDAANAMFSKFLKAAILVEPTEDEISLAAKFERAAQDLNLPFDTGESQLLAILVHRPGVLITGDKRAIKSIEAVTAGSDKQTAVNGRIACFEQLALALCEALGPEDFCTRVCRESATDKTLAICCQCRSGPAVTAVVECLKSYLNSIRSDSNPTLLPGDTLSVIAS